MLDRVWLSRYGVTLIKPNYFEQDDEEMVATAILEYVAKYDTIPDDPDDLLVYVNDSTAADLVYEIYNTETTQFVSDVVIKWAREQEAKIAILDSIEDVKKGNLSSIVERIQKANQVGNDTHSPGIDVINDIDKWLPDLYRHKVRTGLTHIDRYVLDGGLSAGNKEKGDSSELGIILAPPNAGKSMMLINLGYGAASIGSGLNVVHFTHEMGQSQVAKRYAARMTFRFPTQDDNLDEYEDELLIAARKLMPGHVRVIPASGFTVEDIDQKLVQLKREGFKFDVIIDDYPDLIRASRRYTERRYELSGIYTDLRELGSEHGVPVWGASQSTRGSFNKEIITMADIAEDIGKAAIADVIVAVCQTKEESDNNLCRLFMAKVRDNENHQMITAKFFKKQQAVVTTGFAEAKVKEDHDV
jgi:hypothetical protein